MSDWSGTGTPYSSSAASQYITAAELEALIGDDPRAAAIALKAAVASAQDWYCQEATRRIDALILRGTKYEYDQALQFPRIIDGIVVGDADQNATVPEDVERACLEEALAIYRTMDAPELDYKALGIQQIQLGTGAGFQVAFAPGASNMPGLMSPEARRLMRRYTGATIR